MSEKKNMPELNLRYYNKQIDDDLPYVGQLNYAEETGYFYDEDGDVVDLDTVAGFCAGDGKGDDEAAVLDIFQDPFSFFFFDLGLQGLAGSIRRLFVGHLDHIQLTVTAQALGVFAYGVLVKFFFDFPYGDQRDPHDFWSPNSKSISYHTAPPWTEADTPMFL